MTTKTAAVIVCRTLRQLDALVAESLFGWRWWLDVDKGNYMLFPPECRPMSPLMNERWTPKNPDFSRDRFDWSHTLHHYTTWAMLGEVVARVEAAGYYWEVGGVDGESWANVFPKDAIMFDDSPEFSANNESAPVALCLAALASVGINVTYSPEEDMSHFGADSH
jgi:hypothetical protein